MEKFNAIKAKGVYHYALRKPIEKIILDGVRECLQKAKKEVFDDIMELANGSAKFRCGFLENNDLCDRVPPEDLWELKKKHLQPK